MSKGKKKKSLTLIFLILVLVIILGAYLFLMNKNDEKERKEGTSEESITLSSIDSTKVVELTFSNSFGSMNLVKKKEKWIKAKDPEYPINQTYVENMLSAIANITSTKIVTQEVGNLGEYGLAKPKMSVNATLSDGSTVNILIGDVVPNSSDYYAILTGEDTVYVIDSSIYNAYSYSESQMMVLEETPLHKE